MASVTWMCSTEAKMMFLSFSSCMFPQKLTLTSESKKSCSVIFLCAPLGSKLNCSYLLDKNPVSSLLCPLQYFPSNSMGFINSFTLLTIKWKFLPCYSDYNPNMWIHWFKQLQVELYVLVGCSKQGFVNITPLFPLVSSGVGLFAI